MLKIKMIMAALVALGFASQTFAEDSSEMAPPPPKSSAKRAKTPAKAKGPAGTVMKAGQVAKWRETGNALKDKCNTMCTKAACKRPQGGHTIAAECAKNCRKVVAFELVDCTVGAFAAYCGAYAKADEATKAKLDAKKAAGDERCLLLAKANAKIMDTIYLNRDKKKGVPEMFTSEERASASDEEKSREARIWDMLTSIDKGNDVAE
jgi:hypothetical protein